MTTEASRVEPPLYVSSTPQVIHAPLHPSLQHSYHALPQTLLDLLGHHLFQYVFERAIDRVCLLYHGGQGGLGGFFQTTHDEMTQRRAGLRLNTFCNSFWVAKLPAAPAAPRTADLANFLPAPLAMDRPTFLPTIFNMGTKTLKIPAPFCLLLLLRRTTRVMSAGLSGVSGCFYTFFRSRHPTSWPRCPRV